MNTRDKGDLAVLAVATDLMRQGFKVAIPFGDSWDYDLIAMQPEIRKIQVKYTESDGEIIVVRCRSHSVLAGRVVDTKTYTSEMIDCLAVYDKTTDKCFYMPVSEIEGKESSRLRLTPAKNGMKKGIRRASDYERMPD